MGSTARRAFVATVVAVAVIAGALALWHLKVLLALLLFGVTIAAAMRPGVERLALYRVPRTLGVLLHYAVFAALIGLLLWQVVPSLLGQVEHAIGNVPQTRRDLKQAAGSSTGIKHDILVGLQNELRKLPRAGSVAHTA